MLRKRRVVSTGRRGKYLLLHFEHGSLIIHLGMSGHLRMLTGEPPPGKHDHVDLVLGQSRMRFTDPRRFGALLWHANEEGDIESHALLRALGVEPLGCTDLAQRLFRATRTRTAPVKQVLLAGDVHNVPERLAEHAILVLLSDHEGLPLSLIEGMRAGMAIVASRLPGIEELLQDGESALLVNNTPEAVAQALQRLLSDAALRMRLGAAARARYEARHRPEAMAARVLQIYEEAPLLPTARWPMTRPRRHGQALASAQAQAQQRHLLWALLGVPVLALAWLLGGWLQRQGWVTHDFGRTVLASVQGRVDTAHPSLPAWTPC